VPNIVDDGWEPCSTTHRRLLRPPAVEHYYAYVRQRPTVLHTLRKCYIAVCRLCLVLRAIDGAWP
jgi:hypothetical protein